VPVGEVAATFNSVRADLAEQQRRALAAADSIEQAGRRLAAIIGASANPHAHAAVQCFAVTTQRLRDAARLLAEADQAIAGYFALITGGTVPPSQGRQPAQPSIAQPEAATGETAVRDSRGRTVPPGVRRLPSGKYPANFDYAGRVYDGPRWTLELGEKYPAGVRFTDDGFPDFEPYASAKVTFDPHFAGDRRIDEAEANRQAGLPETPLESTWHHHQDTRTMLLVPTDLHDAVRHAGGVSIMKGRA
jgi:hypothetical protein